MKEPQIISICRGCVEDKQFTEFQGTLLDMNTANVVVTVYDALSEKNKLRFVAFPFLKMVDFAWACVEVK